MKKVLQRTGSLIFSSLVLFVFIACNSTSHNKTPQPPVAQRIEKQMILHGDTRIDFYYWMNERENPAVVEYLSAENEYLEKSLSHTEALQDSLFNEMRSRIKEDESSAPYFHNGYHYYTRYEVGSEYPVYCRRKETMNAPEEILLNVSEMAQKYSYFRVGDYSVSPNNQLIAYTVDTLGRRQHTLFVKNLIDGSTEPSSVAYGAGDVEWANDNQTLFFTTIDPSTLRYTRVFRYNINDKEPIEVYYENDETFYYMGVGKTTDGKYLTISPESTLSNEVLILDANNPSGEFRPIQPRQKDLLYYVEHSNGTFFMLTNYQAQNFRLMKTSAEATTLNNWKEVIPHRNEVLLESMVILNDYLVLLESSRALPNIRVINRNTFQEQFIPLNEEVYDLGFHVNSQPDAEVVRYTYTSLTTPWTVLEYDINKQESKTIWQETILGGFDMSRYETKRIFVEARDGAGIPVSLVYKKGMERDGTNPVYQYSYGSYGSSSYPVFDGTLVSLLDRGFIYALAHIRGGQDLGRQWYEDGKLLKKINTFNDFIDVSEYLIAENYTNPELLFAGGGSAGGLLMGAVANMRPDLYKGIVAAVPFVDIVTTMLDESIPLTTAEYDEWGNPNIPEYYHYMLSYSPYDQVSAQEYPNILVTTGLYDSQVQYWEPAKWVAKLRHHNTSTNKIFLQTNMEAGHGGASGRFQSLRELALEYAFLLDLAK
jgi:oligopeptidase B